MEMGRALSKMARQQMDQENHIMATKDRQEKKTKDEKGDGGNEITT